MDDETRDALKMTKEELLAKAAEGKPARVARSTPKHLREKREQAASHSGAITMESDVASIVIRHGYFEDRSVKIGPSSVTVR